MEMVSFFRKINPRLSVLVRKPFLFVSLLAGAAILAYFAPILIPGYGIAIAVRLVPDRMARFFLPLSLALLAAAGEVFISLILISPRLMLEVLHGTVTVLLIVTVFFPFENEFSPVLRIVVQFLGGGISCGLIQVREVLDAWTVHSASMGGYISFGLGKTHFFVLELQRFAPDALLTVSTFGVLMVISMPFRKNEFSQSGERGV